ncbi:MAG: type II toxin-antitoxin system ParD family antitoxin [Candidatus Hydrogenedens sp.]|nr:type II toxin-antitoxin system ParD family antitoxin [Candidatus Hydrogenedens sp.]
MPTQNVNLTAHQSKFIQRVVEQGAYNNASEVVRDALRLLEQRHQEDLLKLEHLRVIAKEAFDALDRGEGVSIPLDEVGAYLARLKDEALGRTRV